jgi:hypothetical protein
MSRYYNLTYYNWTWRSRYPDDSRKPGKRYPTPAMLAGVTNHLGTLDELYRTATQYG